MKRVVIVIAMFVLMYTTAGSSTTSNKPETCHQVVQIQGMVCDFCAGSLKKIFTKKGKKIEIDMEQAYLKVYYKPNDSPMEKKQIQMLVEGAGYNINDDVFQTVGCQDEQK